MDFHRTISAPLLATVFLAAPSVAETTLFGPEVFRRATGKPVTEQRQFETYGYEDPFVLTLVNGTPDGKNRCSSATVWLDSNIVLHPSDFSQKVSQKQVFVSAAEVAVLKVTLASAPGCQVSVSVSGTPRLIGTEGGTFRYPGEIYLTYEPGALAEPVRIELLDLPLSAVDAILAERDEAYRSHVKHALGGFVGKPDGLSFLAPVWASMPVLPLEPGEALAQVAVDVEAGTYWLTDTNVSYDGENHRATMQVHHFSGQAAAALKGHEEPCESCSYWGDPAHSEECSSLNEQINDGVQPACCFMSVTKGRYTCEPGCGKAGFECCKDKNVRSVSESGSWDTQHGDTNCVMVNAELETTYLDCECPDSPPVGARCAPGGGLVYHETLSDTSIGCESTMDISVKIVEPEPVVVCEEAKLRAELEAKKNDGSRAFITEDFVPTWRSFNPNIADFPDPRNLPGTVRTFSAGQATIKVQAPDERYYDAKPLQVRERQSSIVPPGDRSLEVGESLVVQLEVEGVCSPSTTPCMADWTPQQSPVVDIGTLDNLAVIHAKAVGEVSIRGTLRNAEHSLPSWCEAEFSATVIVAVNKPSEPPPPQAAGLSVLPAALPDLEVNQAAYLVAVVESAEGTPMPDVPVEWSVAGPTGVVAVVTSSQNPQALVVAGLGEGAVTITAKASGSAGSSLPPVSVPVTVIQLPGAACYLGSGSGSASSTWDYHMDNFSCLRRYCEVSGSTHSDAMAVAWTDGNGLWWWNGGLYPDNTIPLSNVSCDWDPPSDPFLFENRPFSMPAEGGFYQGSLDCGPRCSYSYQASTSPGYVHFWYSQSDVYQERWRPECNAYAVRNVSESSGSYSAYALETYKRQRSYNGDCANRPPGTICLGFPGGHIWLLGGGYSVLSWRYDCCERSDCYSGVYVATVQRCEETPTGQVCQRLELRSFGEYLWKKPIP